MPGIQGTTTNGYYSANSYYSVYPTRTLTYDELVRISNELFTDRRNNSYYYGTGTNNYTIYAGSGIYDQIKDIDYNVKIFEPVKIKYNRDCLEAQIKRIERQSRLLKSALPNPTIF